MKGFFKWFMVSLIVVFLFSNNDDIPYYWEGEKKHYYEIDPKKILIEFTIDRMEEQNLKVSFPEAETYRIKNDSTIQLITSSGLKLMDRLSDQKNVIQYPAIRVKGTYGTSFITDEISIMFKSQKNESELKEFADKLDLKYLEKTSYGAHLFIVPKRTSTVAIANSIQENEQVLWSNPNFVHLISLFNDPLYPDQYYLNNNAQGGGTADIDINAPEAWNISFGCNDIRVAVIDDGVENHEDFEGRVLAGFTAGGNNTGGLPLNDPSKGHGLACAGILAASHNEIGIKGVAPNSQIIPINIFPNVPDLLNPAGAATNAEIAAAINWAWRPDLGNAHILSNSWGGGTPNADVTTQITNARTIGRDNLGAIVVFSSGNSHEIFSGVLYPATINGVITVVL
ncbi:S8 family serine peptidase [Anditalea andensis]|uniref:S8 family serine peptidase n=1 Tax=Anditalea andensis TaxID=1048983 RepID=UPI0006925BBD